MDKEKLLSIGRPCKTCANCDAPLDRIERHASVIKDAEEASIERLDYCPECWRVMKDEVYESFWMARRQPNRAIPKMNRREKSTALRVLFESLWDRRDADDPDLPKHLFVLAHLLLKWGGLRWRENREDVSGREIVVFEDPVGGDPMEIVSCSVGDADMLAIKRQVEDFLRQYAQDDEFEL